MKLSIKKQCPTVCGGLSLNRVSAGRVWLYYSLIQKTMSEPKQPYASASVRTPPAQTYMKTVLFRFCRPRMNLRGGGG